MRRQPPLASEDGERKSTNQHPEHVGCNPFVASDHRYFHVESITGYGKRAHHCPQEGQTFHLPLQQQLLLQPARSACANEHGDVFTLGSKQSLASKLPTENGEVFRI